MAEKLKRIARKHFKELRNNRKRREKLSQELQKWKEKVCDRKEVSCYPDQLLEYSGEIYRDDCTFRVLENGIRIRQTGTVDRLSKKLVEKANEYRAKIRECDDKLIKKLDGYCDIYNTFPDLIDISKGTIETHEVAEAHEEDEK